MKSTVIKIAQQEKLLHSELGRAHNQFGDFLFRFNIEEPAKLKKRIMKH